MKKVAILTLLFSLLISITGCTSDEPWNDNTNTTAKPPESAPLTEEARALTYDEILHLPTAYAGSVTRERYEDLNALLLSMEVIDVPAALACGEVTETHHYIAWNGQSTSGYTISTLRITGVDSEENGLNLSVGDTIHVYEDYSLWYTKSAENLQYFADQSSQELTNDRWTELEPGTVELLPVTGQNYAKHFTRYTAEIPMEVGKSYTFCMRPCPIDAEGYGQLYLTRGICCVGMEDVDSFLNDAKIAVEDDLLKVAEEIYNRFFPA